MEMSTKNSNGIFASNEDFELVGIFNPDIDFYFNGKTHRISKEYTGVYDYGVRCLNKDKINSIVSLFMTLDLRHTKDYVAEAKEIMYAYERRQI